MRGIEAQFLALQKGFNELISQHLLRPFDERELEVRNPGTVTLSLFNLIAIAQIIALGTFDEFEIQILEVLLGALHFSSCDKILQEINF